MPNAVGHEGDLPDPGRTDTGEATIWVVMADPSMFKRISGVMDEYGLCSEHVESLLTPPRTDIRPDLVVAYVPQDLDAVKTILSMKPPAPLVLLMDRPERVIRQFAAQHGSHLVIATPEHEPSKLKDWADLYQDFFWQLIWSSRDGAYREEMEAAMLRDLLRQQVAVATSGQDLAKAQTDLMKSVLDGQARIEAAQIGSLRRIINELASADWKVAGPALAGAIAAVIWAILRVLELRVPDGP